MGKHLLEGISLCPAVLLEQHGARQHYQFHIPRNWNSRDLALGGSVTVQVMDPLRVARLAWLEARASALRPLPLQWTGDPERIALKALEPWRNQSHLGIPLNGRRGVQFIQYLDKLSLQTFIPGGELLVLVTAAHHSLRASSD
jgi:hypothetical protein